MLFNSSQMFQSTLPVWGATLVELVYSVVSKFQSTLPVWGATELEITSRHGQHCFNPRSPCGERRVASNADQQQAVVSIHAPRVGSDATAARAAATLLWFQSTLPVWGATSRRTTSATANSFQSTLPVWGATRLAEASPEGFQFQSTLPVWGATCLLPSYPKFKIVSIHAPRVGSDVTLDELSLGYTQFQSTLPVWGATVCAAHDVVGSAVSIHAPRVGSDRCGSGSRPLR